MDGKKRIKKRILTLICFCALVTAVFVTPATAAETAEKCYDNDEFILKWDDRREVIGGYTVEFADYDIGSIDGRPASALLNLYKNDILVKRITVTNVAGQSVFEYPESESSSDDPEIKLVVLGMTDVNMSNTGFDGDDMIGRVYSPAVMFEVFVPCLTVEIMSYDHNGDDVDEFESDKYIKQFVGESVSDAVINARIRIENEGSLDARNVGIKFDGDGLVVLVSESTDKVSETELVVSYKFTEDIIPNQIIEKNIYLKFPDNLTKEAFRMSANVSRTDDDGLSHAIRNDKVVEYAPPAVVKSAPRSTVWGENTYAYMSIENMHGRPYDKIVIYDELPGNFILSFNLSEKDTTRSSWVYDVWKFAGFVGNPNGSVNISNNTTKSNLVWVYHPDRELDAWGWDDPSLSRWTFDPLTGIWKWDFASGDDELVYDKSSNTIRWVVSLRGNQAKSIAYPMMSERPGEYRIPRARATWERGGEAYMEYSAGEIIKMEGPFVIVEKSADRTNVEIGEMVNITTTITSSGTIPANISLVDVLPDNSTLVMGKLEQFAGYMKPGDTKSFTYMVRLNTPGQILIPLPNVTIFG
ncbi:MAG: hypothetical protein KAH86_05125, partial [Methanosarcinales archaeon]|nr:hypothetical protein [Methanosarcinales archaeon]